MSGSFLLFLEPPLTFWDAEFQVRPLVKKGADIPVLFLSCGCIHVPPLQGQGTPGVIGGTNGAMGFARSPV